MDRAVPSRRRAASPVRLGRTRRRRDAAAGASRASQLGRAIPLAPVRDGAGPGPKRRLRGMGRQPHRHSGPEGSGRDPRTRHPDSHQGASDRQPDPPERKNPANPHPRAGGAGSTGRPPSSCAAATRSSRNSPTSPRTTCRSRSARSRRSATASSARRAGTRRAGARLPRPDAGLGEPDEHADQRPARVLARRHRAEPAVSRRRRPRTKSSPASSRTSTIGSRKRREGSDVGAADRHDRRRRSDPDCGQMFQNLIGNALKFAIASPDQPPHIVTITAAMPLWPTSPSRPTRRLPDGAKRMERLAFQDNGIGFDQQHEKRIFEASSHSGSTAGSTSTRGPACRPRRFA